MAKRKAATTKRTKKGPNADGAAVELDGHDDENNVDVVVVDIDEPDAKATKVEHAPAETTATAAAVATLRSLDRPLPAGVGDWFLERWHPAGGFCAAPDAPLPDLLSTAVALHALDALDASWRDRRETVLDFIDSLWTNVGAFHGSWADDEPDAEYTFYGLVALGHASV